MDRYIRRLISQNTAALNRVADLLNRWLDREDKELVRQKRRQELLNGVPYAEWQLVCLKRQDLVMLARQLGIINTSQPQRKLIDAIMAQQDIYLQQQSQ